MADPIRIGAREVARFVADGYLRFDGVIPEEMNHAVMAELQGQGFDCRYNNEMLDEAAFLAQRPAYRRVVDHPVVRGALDVLVGEDPRCDHLAVHTVRARTTSAQFWHADATIDPRLEAFDVQVFYYPHDTPREAGGTLILPGSHFRRVHESTIARYQNIAGQVPMVCPAGTILIAHHNLWHCSQPNRTADTRYMMKLRLNPTVVQRGLFADDAPAGEIGGILSTWQTWLGAEHRLEILQRLRLWRALTGSEFDWDLWLSRLDASPAPALATA